MPRLLATKWTRFHVGGSAAYPTGRHVDFAEHSDLRGPTGEALYFADISEEEAEQLKSDDHDLVTPMGWTLVLTEDERAAAAKLAVKDAQKDGVKANKPASSSAAGQGAQPGAEAKE